MYFMDVIFDFISTHYQLIINLVILAISIVVFILRKPNKNVLLDPSASSTLIDLIKEAENKFGSGHGEDKLSYVICKYFDLAKISLSDQHWLYIIVKDLVEKILSTPSKK